MRLGYWVSEKKSKKLNFEEFGVLCRNVGYELVKIDLDLSLEEQGPFDVIIHKLTDVLAKVNEGCVVSEQRMQRFQEFTDKHTECIIIDPMESIYKLLDRYEQYKVVQQCDLLGSHVFTPAFVELTTTDVETNKKKLREGKVQYPIVCKPTVAHGSQFSHQMLLVFNDGGLVDIQPPCVAQTFINHGARLYKLFVIGESMQLVERPSLRNLSAGDHKTIFFDAQDVSKPYSCHDLNVLDDELDQGPVKPDLQKMKVLADDLRSHLQMELFGVDVIIDCETEQYGVIDINFFPGYEGVPDFFSLLLKLVQKLLLQKKITNIALGCNNNEDKSNFLRQQQEHKISEQRTVPKNISNVIGHCPSSVLQDSCHKRLKLDQMENGVRSPALSYPAGGDSTAERSNSTRSNGSSTPVVTNGNASLCFCSPSNGYRSVEKETNGTDLGNGLPSLRSNGLIVVDIDRQML